MRSAQASFPVVGIGASAGGLEAFSQLLRALPRDTGMAFVLVQHLDPEHESALVQLLSRATSLPVREIKHDQPVRPDHVHVIPRDTNLSIAGGVLKLQPRERTRKPHRPIDSFFESLAADQHERAIGVVLSGTASDGTLGLEAIKAEGGITFAQDDSAKYDSMPRSAVAAGCVEILLIEDNADARRLLRDALEAAGYDVYAAADGEAGIQAQIRAPADVVVTDLFMPNKEGLETITELRKRTPRTKIIAISGGSRLRGSQTDHLATACEIGADAVLKKPFDPTELIAIVRRILPPPSARA